MYTLIFAGLLILVMAVLVWRDFRKKSNCNSCTGNCNQGRDCNCEGK